MQNVFFFFSVKRMMFKSLREEVQEMEIAHEDPAKMLHQVTKRKYVLSTLFPY